jgi:hypothetical protein
LRVVEGERTRIGERQAKVESSRALAEEHRRKAERLREEANRRLTETSEEVRYIASVTGFSGRIPRESLAPAFFA